MTAFFWGLTSWLTLIYAPVLYSFFTMAVLLTLSGGATLPLGSVFHAFFTYSVTILLMLSSSFLYYGGEVHTIIAFVTIVAMIILVLSGHTYFRKIKRMIELSIELKEFNRALEERVKSEVAKNIEKDTQLMHQARLAQVGEMVGMIAHQWRQPLHIMSTAATEMDLKIHLDTIDYSSCQKNLDTINTMTQHLSATIDDFRDFFKITRAKERTSFDEVVTATLRIIKEHIEDNNITLHTNLQSSELFYSYPNELKQVLLNLLKNAEDVIAEKAVSTPQIRIHTFNDEMNIFLEVCDNGGGVPAELTEYIFDAYFSSKPQDKGTGLGLYMSKKIIEEHCGGELSFRNDDEGACFRIRLPKS
ncbi:HAMP domain-containing sensor histidine kinase [Sulfurimonas sp. HSL3-7]|uniref:sensor histidine kinase n=1 Tax=Sulfonitrofixus jiaomeiensis TaxID=3131938 RepID=UPI0031F73C80